MPSSRRVPWPRRSSSLGASCGFTATNGTSSAKCASWTGPSSAARRGADRLLHHAARNALELARLDVRPRGKAHSALRPGGDAEAAHGRNIEAMDRIVGGARDEELHVVLAHAVDDRGGAPAAELVEPPTDEREALRGEVAHRR